MSKQEIMNLCLTALDHPVSGGYVSFVIPGRWANRKRLAGKGSPFGEAIAEYEDAVLCTFNAQEVIDWLNRDGK